MTDEKKVFDQTENSDDAVENTEVDIKIDVDENNDGAEISTKTGTKEEVESIQESLVRDVCEFYGRPYEEGDREQPSMRATAEKFGISAMKVKKILVTGGLFQTETTDEIQRLYACGLTVKQISGLKNISVSNVNSYLPYEKVIYNLDVRNEEAVKALEWRQKQANRIVGRPTKALQRIFSQAMDEFTALYDRPLEVRLAACNINDGATVLLHFLRQYGFMANVPAGITLEQYIASIDGHVFMYGNEDGAEVDGILIRDDKDDLKETFIRMLSQIYCRRYEVDGGFFYRDHCEEGDELEQKIMKSGYAVWSGYITERMTEKVLGREKAELSDVLEDIEYDTADVVKTGDPAAMSWILLNTVGRDNVTGFFPNTRAVVAGHGDEIAITQDFIWILGRTFLIESQEAQIEELRNRKRG